jgi:hypothetical protein
MTGKLTVVNMYGGPGTGKSTTAAGLFFLLKVQDINCELSREFAKDLVWGLRTHLFDQQAFVYTEQARRLRELEGKVDIAVTDSPLLMSLVYGNPPKGLRELVRAERDRYQEFDVLLLRVKDYQQAGRTQTEEQAMEVDEEVRRQLPHPDFTVNADEMAPYAIVQELRSKSLLPEGALQ